MKTKSILCKLRFALATILILAPLALAQSGINSFQTTIFSVATTATPILQRTAILYHQLSWVTNGTVLACSVQLDSSPDGVTWTSGGIITTQDCSSNNSSSVTAGIAVYVRVNVTALTGTGTVTVYYKGWAYNPSGGSTGTVTSVDGSGQNGVETESGDTPGAITTSGVVRGTLVARTVTTNTSLLASDRGKAIQLSGIGGFTLTLPTSGAGFVSGYEVYLKQLSASSPWVLSPATGTIDGQASINFFSTSSDRPTTVLLRFDGTNWFTSFTAPQLWQNTPNLFFGTQNAGAGPMQLRSITSTDLPTIPASKGGTGINSSASTGCPSISAGVWSVGTCNAGSANTALSNLASVAINTALLPGVDNSIALGSSSFRWNQLFLSGPVTLTDTAANTDFSMSNTTAATSGTSQSSPIASWGYRFWTGAADAAGTVTLQAKTGNGTNAATSLTIAKTGSTGNFQILTPDGALNAPMYSFTGDANMGMLRIGSALWLQGDGSLVLSPSSGSSSHFFGSSYYNLNFNPAWLIFGTAGDTSLSRKTTNTLSVDTTAAGNGLGSLSLTNLTAAGAVTESLGAKFTTTHGSNATAGVSTLSGGTVTVSTTAIAALATAGGSGDVVTLTLQNCSTCGTLSVGTVTAGTSFVINSTNIADASNVYWEIRHVN